MKAFSGFNRLSPRYVPGTYGYLLMADAIDNEPYLHDGQAKEPIPWLPGPAPGKRQRFSNRAVGAQKGPGYTRTDPPVWQALVPLRLRAMVATGDTLYVAGVPDEVPEDDPLAAFEGRGGGSLAAFDKKTGKFIGDRKLDFAPVFDGLIAAGGRLFISSDDGTVRCLSPVVAGKTLELKHDFKPGESSRKKK